jgi:thiol:disulfide interchange protein DsbA
MPSSTRRRELIIALSASPLIAAGAAHAQAPSVPEASVDYNILANPQPTDAPGKIEVLDFFWYGCPHCYAFLPDLESWRKRQPADVDYHHVAVDFGDPNREVHTKLFYALQALNRVDEMHVKVFDAFHIKHLRLNDRDSIADFMAANGISRDKWLSAFDSFSVAGSVKRARMTCVNYTVDGTPTIAIDGRYLTSPSIEHTHTFPGTLGTMSYLVDHTRQERSHRKS